MSALAIRLHANDTVVVALTVISPGHQLDDGPIVAPAKIPAGHKIASTAMGKGAPVVKYNQIIGFATTDIAAGDHVHTHNLGIGQFERDYAFSADIRPTPTFGRTTFEGFVREDGQVGTRNFIGVEVRFLVASQRPVSSRRRIRRCFSACRTIWTSIVGQLPAVERPLPKSGGRSWILPSRPPPAVAPKARRQAWAARSSNPGSSAPSCRALNASMMDEKLAIWHQASMRNERSI